MDIRSAYSAALSSLSVTQYQSSITSANIANANVEGYSALNVNTKSVYSDGQVSGVGVASVSSYVNENLYRSYVSASSQTNYANTMASYQSQLLDSYGSVDGANTLADHISDFETALADLSVTPESQTIKNTVLSEADELADSLNNLSDDVQNQRKLADKEIETTVDAINQALASIDELNEEIAVKSALGENTATLEDARNQALKTVGEYMDVTYFTTGTNEMHVYTSGGLPLVDSRAHELSYEASGNVSPSTTFNEITLDGRSVTNQISGGSLGALIELRDEVFPQRQAELDELALNLSQTLNSVFNTGTPFPPPNEITSVNSVSASDPFSASGTMRIVLADENGDAQSVNDLDLSTYATVGDLVSAINALSGISATIDSDGQFVISSDDADMGIALSEMDSSVGVDAQGVSDYFGFNDLFVGEDAASIKIRPALLENPSLLATGQLSQDAALSVGDTALSAGDNSTVLALQSVMGNTIDFNSAGDLDATSQTFQGYASEMLSSFALSTDKAESQAATKQLISENLAMDISNQSGVNLDEEAARLTVLENQYSASAQIIQTLNDMFSSLLNAVA